MDKVRVGEIGILPELGKTGLPEQIPADNGAALYLVLFQRFAEQIFIFSVPEDEGETE